MVSLSALFSETKILFSTELKIKLNLNKYLNKK